MFPIRSGPYRGSRRGRSALHADRRRLFRRCRHGFLRRLLFRRQLLPVASFFKASAHRADLRLFLHGERRAALRAWLRHGHERRSEIAIRVTRAAIEHAESSAPALPHASALHKFAFIALGALDTHGDRPGVLALRVSRATDELPKPPVLFHQPVSVQRAFLVQRFVRLVSNSRPRHQAPRRLAIRITGASQKRAKSPPFQRHLLSAVFAVLNLVLGVFRNFFRHVLNEIAFRIPRASQEKSVPADPFQQFALPALFALFPGRNPGLVRNHLVAGLIQVHDEFFPELFHRLPPRQLAFFNLVQLFFQPRGEFHVEHVLKTLDQQHAHALAQHGRSEPPLILLHVLALDNRRNNRSIRRRPPDAVLFQLLHQRGFCIPRRRLRKILLRLDGFQFQDLPLGHPRQRLAFSFVVLFVVFAIRARNRYLVHLQESVKLHDRSRGPERVIPRVYINRRLVVHRRQHLRSHKSLPDQLVQLEDVVLQILAHVFRRPRNLRRTNRLVRSLSVLLRLVEVRLLRQVRAPEPLRDQLPHLLQRIVRDLQRILPRPTPRPHTDAVPAPSCASPCTAVGCIRPAAAWKS